MVWLLLVIVRAVVVAIIYFSIKKDGRDNLFFD